MDEAFSLHQQRSVVANAEGVRFYVDATFALLWNSLDLIVLVLLSTVTHLLFSSENFSRIGCLFWFILSFALSFSCTDRLVMLALALYLVIPKTLCLLHFIFVRQKYALLFKWLVAYMLSMYIYYHTSARTATDNTDKGVSPHSHLSPFWLHEVCWIMFVWTSCDWPWMQLAPTKRKFNKWSTEEDVVV